MAKATLDLPCPGCGETPTPGARFCSDCGASLAEGETLELPTSSVRPDPRLAVSPDGIPPTLHQVHRRPLGIHPIPLLGGAGGLGLLVALILLATGSLVAGLVLLCLALGALALFTSAVRRQPDAPAARSTLRAADRSQSLVRLAAVTVRARTRAWLTLLRIRGRQAWLRRALNQRLGPLGHAVYRGDQGQARELKQQAEELERQLNQAELEASATAAAARAEINRERATVDRTEALPEYRPDKTTGDPRPS